MIRPALAAILCLLAIPVGAHPLAPALLELGETEPAHYAVLWRTTAQRAQVADVTPALPPECALQGAEPQAGREGNSLTLRWRVSCAGGLPGRTLRFPGLARSRISVILRIEALDGAVTQALLDARQPDYTVSAPAAAAQVFPRYVALGIEHLFTGVDHVLFVVGLLLLIGRFYPLLITVTAFTLGHSLTLALATLDYVRTNTAAMELGIAISILVLAVELARPRDARPALIARRPGLMAGIFGLLHGLGFASALAEVGLPQGEIPLALFAFNLGIELGQLAVIGGLLAIAAAARQAARFDAAPARVAAVYVIGSLAAFWCFERAVGLMS